MNIIKLNLIKILDTGGALRLRGLNIRPFVPDTDNTGVGKWLIHIKLPDMILFLVYSICRGLHRGKYFFFAKINLIK